MLVRKSTFADASVGLWGSENGTTWGVGINVSATASSSGELRVKDRDNLESGNTFAATPGETFHVSFDVNSSLSLFGGAVGLMFHNATSVTGWTGVGYAPSKPWERVSGSVVAPAGTTHATPWLQIDAFPWDGVARPYVAFDALYIARGQEGTGSANLVIKPTFNDAALGGWVGSTGVGNMSAVAGTRGGDGMVTTVRRDSLESDNNFNVFAGETLHISYEVSSISSAHGGAFGVMFKDDLGVIIAWLGVGYGSGGAWSRKTGTVVVPSGAATATPWLQIDCPHGGNYGPVSFRNLHLSRHARGTLGPFARRARTRTVYQRIASGDNTKAPEDDPINWLPISPINEWAMFDREINTKSRADSSISTTLHPGPVNSLGLFGLEGTELQVLVRNGVGGPIVYGNSELSGPKIINLDGTLIADWYQYYYEPYVSLDGITLTDLPPYINANLTITVTGHSSVAIGLVDVGNFYDLGGTEYSPSLTLVDYSKKSTDEFGVTTFVKRSFAKRLQARSMFSNVQLSVVAAILADLRAKPCSWSVSDSDDFNALNIFGWFEDMDIDVAYANHSYCTISVQGLTET
jgi:hypothetical protein